MNLLLNQYSIWITSLTGLSCNQIVNELVNKGYIISSLGGEGVEPTLDSKSSLSAVIALKLSSDKKLVIMELHNMIAKMLSENKILYHSLIISEFVNCLWSGSNITKLKEDTIKKILILN